MIVSNCGSSYQFMRKWHTSILHAEFVAVKVLYSMYDWSYLKKNDGFQPPEMAN